MYIDLKLFAKAQYLALVKTPFSVLRWSYIFLFTALYWIMWLVVAAGRALDHLLFPGFKRQAVQQPVFIVAPPRSGTTLTQKLLALDKERFIYNALYQTIFPAVTFQRLFDFLVWCDAKTGRPLTKLMRAAERRWFGGWDEMHKLRFDEPEEDDGFFVYTFLTEAIFLLFLRVDELWVAGFHDALPPSKRRKLMAFYRSCLQRRLYASGPGKAILCKATQSSGAVESLLESFPDARFITLIRDPAESVASHVSVFWPAWKTHSPELRKDGQEAKAYAHLAVRWFQHLFAFRNKVDPARYYCIDYRDLTRDPAATLERLYQHFGWPMSDALREALVHANGRQRDFASNHRYSLEEFGLTKEWICDELGELLSYYRLNGRQPPLDGFRNGTEAPPSHVQQSQRNQQKTVADHGRRDPCPVKTLNGDEQRKRNVTVARANGHDIASAAFTATKLPSENQ